MEFEGLTINNAQNIRRYLEELRPTTARDAHPWEWFGRFLKAHPEHREWCAQAVRSMLTDQLVDGRLRLNDDTPTIFTLAVNNRLYELRDLVEAELARDVTGHKLNELEWLLQVALGLTNEFEAPLPEITTQDIAKLGQKKGLFHLTRLVLTKSGLDTGADFVIGELSAAVKRGDPKALDSVADAFGLEFEDTQRERILAALQRVDPDLLPRLKQAIDTVCDYLDDEERATIAAEFDSVGD